MNYKTHKVKKYNPQGSINPQLLKHSAEYLVLAVLKYHMPLKYKKAVLSERTDTHYVLKQSNLIIKSI